MTTSFADRVHFVLTRLSSPVVQHRATALRVQAVRPLPDRRLLVRAEALLSDTSPCVLEIPLLYGEVRWRAAQAVAALRAVLGVDDVVRLEGVVIPLSSNQVMRLAGRYDVHSSPTSVDGVLECMEVLHQRGLLPTRNLIEDPVRYREHM